MSDSTETEPDFVTATVAHHPRRTDVDPRAAKRAERQVATMFVLAALLILASVVAYVVIPVDAGVNVPFLGPVGRPEPGPRAEPRAGHPAHRPGRHPLGAQADAGQRGRGDAPRDALGPDERQAAVEAFDRGLADSGFAQRPIIRRTLIGAMLVLPLPLVIILRDLYTAPEGAPSPAEQLERTIWGTGVRIVTDVELNPLKPEDVPVGGLVAAVPANLNEVEEETGNLNARAKAAIILVRMVPDEIVSQQGEKWDYQGILAYSKICTHVGCPIALYEQRTHHLLCPCHQSTFDLADSGNVVFGPAARQMPQLPITVDDEGYLVAVSDFQQPVGPSFWERS